MKYEIEITGKFKRDYKAAVRRGQNICLLKNTINILARGDQLPEHMHDHPLTGSWIGYRECHITPDWLLIYKIKDDLLVLMLTRTGLHSDLF